MWSSDCDEKIYLMVKSISAMEKSFIKNISLSLFFLKGSLEHLNSSRILAASSFILRPYLFSSLTLDGLPGYLVSPILVPFLVF